MAGDGGRGVDQPPRRSVTWTRRVPTLQVPVTCSGQRHTVLWKRGSLVVVDHDVAADAVVVALGGDAPACLEVLRSWRIGYIEEQPPTASTGLLRTLSSLGRWMGGGGPAPVVLPEPLRRMREVSILHTWGRGLRDGRAGNDAQDDFLERAVARRIRDLIDPQLFAVYGTWPHDRDVDVVINPDRSAPISVSGRASLEGIDAVLEIPVTWITSVWVPGLEVLRGGLLLDVDRRTPASALVARWLADGEGGWILVADWEPLV